MSEPPTDATRNEAAEQPAAGERGPAAPSARLLTALTRWRSPILFAVVTIVAGYALLGSLGAAPLRIFDEALYGKFARHALASGNYLYAIERTGEFTRQFSKPPLSVWVVAASMKLLGASLASLRLPFALATLGTVWVCFAWGRRIAGDGFAVTWALTLALSGAALRWGRTACIEPLFIFWILLALWAHGGAVLRRGRRATGWSALAGLGLALAFLTKQLAVGIGVLPILIYEGVTLRRAGALAEPERASVRRRALTRLAWSLGVPAALGGAWVARAAAEVGAPLFQVMVGKSVVKRIGGFRGGHARTLNEVGEILTDVMSPFPWVLGFVGLLLLCIHLWSRRDRAPTADAAAPEPDSAWLLPLFLLASVLLYENVTRSVLPWYVYALVPALAGGVAWLLSAPLRLAARVDHGSSDMSEWSGFSATAGAATLGAATLLIGVSASVGHLISQVNLVVAAAGLGLWLWWRAREGGRASLVRRAALGFVATGVAVIALGFVTHPKRDGADDPYAALMEVLDDRGITRVMVSRDAKLDSRLLLSTYFGMRTLQLPAGARLSEAPEGTEAVVTAQIPPSEYAAPSGVEIVRAPGAVALVGEPARVTWGDDALAAMLSAAAGPGARATFEAEHLSGGEFARLVHDPAASGGVARAVIPTRGRELESFPITRTPRLSLPAGRYTARLRVRWDCGGMRVPAFEARIFVGGKKQVGELIHCGRGAEGEGEGEYQELELEFRVRQKDKFVLLALVYLQGSVWHDSVALARRPGKT